MSSLSSRKFVIGLADSSESSPRASRRCIVNADIIKAAKLCAGDAVALSDSDNANEARAFAIGIIWPSHEVSQDTIHISKSAFLTARLTVAGHANIHVLSDAVSAKSPLGLPSLRKIKEAGIIILNEVTSNTSLVLSSVNAHEKGKRRDWLTLLLRETLVNLKYLTHTQVIEVTYEGHARRFSVVAVSAAKANAVNQVDDLTDGLKSLDIHMKPQVWTVGWESAVRILEKQPDHKINVIRKPEIEALIDKAGPAAYASVGGLEKQIAQIRDLLEIPLTRPDLFYHFGLKPPRGILLHGPPGTGKTHLARAIASSTKSSVLIINGPELSSAYHGETEAKLRDVFKEAREKSPCIVVLDEVDALVPRREDGAGGEVEKRVVATLLTILDGMEDEAKAGVGGENRVVVIGTTNRPNAIDPALRRPGRFDREIEIGIPNAQARHSILNVLLAKTAHSISQLDLQSIAARAHGYVGADLSAVVREAGTIAIKRWLSAQSLPAAAGDGSAPAGLTLTLNDLVASLPTIRPSAMRSVFMDTAPIQYSEIGGQASVIQKLREAVEWPLLHPEAFARLGVRPPKGVLLYGPPGCSKTVLARACACESGVNFVAVKGPELLNKFVGESERGVREIFRKARAAAPSIIFFDEIDALATSRASGDGDSGTGSHEGVLTSLLNEMDGVEELIGVTIVAATNRPDVIDSALMRPGRLDRILYVGPPDQHAREEILKIRTKNMSVAPDIDVEKIARITEGCSGAEITALCQEAALLTMKEDINAPFVPCEAFLTAARSMKRQITPEVLAKFAAWGSKYEGQK